MAGEDIPRHPGSLAPAPADPRPGRPDHRWRHRVVALALILVGAVVFAYPVAETLVTNHQISGEAATYIEAVRASDPAPSRPNCSRRSSTTGGWCPRS